MITEIRNANTKRVDYINSIKAKRERRLLEIKDDNVSKLKAPFDYQLRLLEEEKNDILQARSNAIRDSNDAFTDLESRLGELQSHISEDQAIEVEKITAAINRAIVDHKNPAKVLYALRIDWLVDIVIDPTNNTLTTATTFDYNIYEDIFSDFHYDIGHGKGTGEGKIDTAPIVDGFNNRSDPRQTGPVGDYERDIGAQTRAWETPGSRHSGQRF